MEQQPDAALIAAGYRQIWREWLQQQLGLADTPLDKGVAVAMQMMRDKRSDQEVCEAALRAAREAMGAQGVEARAQTQPSPASNTTAAAPSASTTGAATAGPTPRASPTSARQPSGREEPTSEVRSTPNGAATDTQPAESLAYRLGKGIGSGIRAASGGQAASSPDPGVSASPQAFGATGPKGVVVGLSMRNAELPYAKRHAWTRMPQQVKHSSVVCSFTIVRKSAEGNLPPIRIAWQGWKLEGELHDGDTVALFEHAQDYHTVSPEKLANLTRGGIVRIVPVTEDRQFDRGRNLRAISYYLSFPLIVGLAGSFVAGGFQIFPYAFMAAVVVQVALYCFVWVVKKVFGRTRQPAR